MSEETSQIEPGIHPKLTNPLSEETRKERVYLLGMSAIGITIAFTGLIPTEITALGIKVAEADRKSLVVIFAFVVGYFLVAFGSYAQSDLLEWLSARRDLAVRRRRRDIQRPIQKERKEIRRRLKNLDITRARESVRKSLDELAEANRIVREVVEASSIGQDVSDCKPTDLPRERREQSADIFRDRLKELEVEEESLRSVLAQLDMLEIESEKDIAEYEKEIALESEAPFGLTGPIIILRFGFEFIVPPAVGIFAIVALLIRAL